MNERIKSLYPSLVGSSIEFRFKPSRDDSPYLEKSIRVTKEKIGRDVKTALALGGRLCVMLLAELTNFYRNEPYYMAVRSAIEMRRYRPAVLDYLELSVQERADRLKDVLSKKYASEYRELNILTAKYFLGTYPNRIKDFKKLFTREEYLLIV